MSPELLVQMFETIDNVSMVKESTGDLSRMQRIEALSGGRLPFYNGSDPPVLDALQAGAAEWCTGRAVSATAALHRPVWRRMRRRIAKSARYLR